MVPLREATQVEDCFEAEKPRHFPILAKAVLAFGEAQKE